MSGVRRIDDMEPAGIMIALDDHELGDLLKLIVCGRPSISMERLKDQILDEFPPELLPPDFRMH